ncbi:MAG: hypothetical protein Q8O67_30280 [Deltaproteobacteria bacterium]|nr:hypothetical protein [Deltaproteobacteria bacterium]
MHRLGLQTLPAAGVVERSAVAPALVEGGRINGRAIGENARGDKILVDVVNGFVCRLDASGTEGPHIAIACAQDPLTPGLVGVDDVGSRALVLSARSMHGDPSLVLVDLDTGTTETVRAFAGPGWIVGGFAGPRAGGRASVVSCEQHLGDAPRFSVVVNAKSVWSSEAMQPPCVPIAVKDNVVALLLCVQPDPVSGTGPTSVCVLDLVTGTLQPLARAGGTRLRLEDGAIVVDGGRERVRIALA